MANTETEWVIHLQGITKSYAEGGQRRPLFSDLEATFRRGEITVLMGRSGSGKSTLLNLISGIDIPDAGDVFLDGVAITRLSERERTLLRRRHIGFVFQFFNLIPTLSVAENLLLPLELLGTRRTAAWPRVHGLLERVGLGERLHSFPDRLSGGEQQRVAIVRALVHDPPLLLADEPTGNLDADTGREVLRLLTSLTRNRGKSLVMVTHSEEAASFADRVLRFAGGRLREEERAG